VKPTSGIRCLEDIPGTGEVARKGDRVTYNLRLFLNQGDEVPLDELQRKHLLNDQIRVEGGRDVVDRVVTLGKREVSPAVERTLIGMRVGGYRKVRTSPHLAYRQEGIPGLIPENAVLIVELWLRAIHPD
jgi:hypothetical protein